ncbi:MAG: PSD1 and planctomycete cytochrome C domain-containing protein [Planctomycetota bacterium]
MKRFLCSVLTAATLVTTTSVAVASELTAEELQFFETKIRPVLVKECYGCHSEQAGNVRGGLRLDTKALMQIGGSSGPAIVPGNVEDSFLYNAMNHEDWVMPPKRKLSDSVLADFRKWIEMGAPDPRENSFAEIRSSISQEDIDEARDSFWAYQKPTLPASPQVREDTWSKTEVDRFILARLQEAELSPSPDAEPHVVLRRLCFDLVGLPPTPEQVAYFAKYWDQDPDRAIAHVVDRLLESKQYGERWGRHWLDVARFAESTGREVNMTYPHAWRYRDYVIDSFNQDKPYNEFVQEQIAGDLLPVETDAEWAEHLVATTFLAMGPKNVNEQNRVQFRTDLLDEQIDATTRVFLGTSVSCARCHDHKFDPIPQKDYYALAGVFANLTTYFGNPPSEYGAFSFAQKKQNSSLLLLPTDEPDPVGRPYTRREFEALQSELEEALARAGELRRERGNDRSNITQSALRQRLANQNRIAELSDKLSVLDSTGQPRSYTMGVQEKASPRNVPLLVRGEIDQPTEEVARGFPRVLCEESIQRSSDESGRLELARWIGSDRNSLAARVMVNRVWKHLFGNGIVKSTENFGATGAAPTHPELLDYLAVRFVSQGWSVKKLIREMVTSRTYRQSSRFNEECHLADADNSLLWRIAPRRLEAESIRDAMLMASGDMDLKRPTGSEVAKAGYVRVREGALGNPRDLLKKYVGAATEELRQSFQQQMQGSMRERFSRGGRSQGRRGMGSRGTAGQPNSMDLRERVMAAATEKVQGQLEMTDSNSRSVYLPVVRDEIPRSLEVFDFVDSSTITGVREQSNTANQALYLMNNPFVDRQAEAFAKRLNGISSRAEEQVESAFLIAFSRPPSKTEQRGSLRFLRGFDGDRDLAIKAFCQSLLASAEFRYLD